MNRARKLMLSAMAVGLWGCAAGAGETCVDEFEGQRATEIQALEVTPTDDCDSNVVSTNSHRIGACGNVHYYRVDATDTKSCVVDPVLEATGADLRVCMFFSCKEGATSVECKSGGGLSRSDNGLLGCCGLSPGIVKADIECGNGLAGILRDDSAQVFLRVDRLSVPDAGGALEQDRGDGATREAKLGAGSGCINYGLTFHF